jgi:4-hydroxy-4-methyl-2-oxoglutarate aldolase
MTEILDDELLHQLRRLDACTLANAIETFDARLRNEGFVNHTVRSLFPELAPMVGYAATVKIRGSAPPTVNSAYPDRTDWLDYIDSLPTPRVVVIQDTATQPGLCSLVGEVHMSILRALHCEGVITNGAVRDITAARSAGFPCFAGSVSVSHGYVHIVDFGRPVMIGGLEIKSGDLLHGDLHGVQSIPLALARLIPGVAARITAREQALIALCRSADFTLEKLRAFLARDRNQPV